MIRWMLRLALILAAISSFSTVALADVRVVATLPALGALVSDVGGGHVEVTTLASASEDPHYVEARPDFVLSLSRADLVVAVGMELEVGWLPTLRQQARNPAITGGNGYFEAATAVSAMHVPASLDRAQGDVHPGGNPHFIYDARAMAQVARAIGERLAVLDPAQADAYRAGGEATARSLEAMAADQQARFAALPSSSRAIAAYHDSFPYMTDWLGLRQVATVEPRPGVPPTPSHTASVVSTMRSERARVVLQEGFYPASTSQTIASMVGGSVVIWSAGPAPGESCEAWLRRGAEALYDALG